jgi:hypothetical protein
MAHAASRSINVKRGAHAKFKNVYDARNQLRLKDCNLRHVFAHGLHSLVAPTSLKAHHTLDPDVKLIWDSAMAIATIQYNANNCPKHAKYRLVVLGNLDYHTWSKEDTPAPVMSQLELRLLTSLAIYHKHVPKIAMSSKPSFSRVYLQKKSIFYALLLAVRVPNRVNIGIY